VSARAAWRLESLGFTEVFDYPGGKRDWAAAGFPVEGRKAHETRIGSLARRDVPTARMDEAVAGVAERARERGYDTAVVVNEEGIVLGRLFARELRAGAGSPARAGDVMRPGPSTYHPDMPAAELLEQLLRRRLKSALVTTPEGRLLGLFLTADAMAL
jgi:CBS domain-containing protein